MHLSRRSNLEKRSLVTNQHPRNTGTSKRADDPAQQRTHRHLCYSAPLSGRELRENTDLDSDGGDVAEAAEGVGGD